jgi:hypothetical protein
MKRCIGVLMIVLLGIVALGATVPGRIQPPPLLPRRPVSFAQSFRLLMERNIFDASRSPYVNQPVFSTTTATVQQNSLTLTGLVYEDGTYAAFVENSGTNTTTKYKIGDAVSGGKIIGAGMDYVDLLSGGRTIHVILGQNMSGMSPVATTNPTTEPSPGNDMIERLRLRRLQELHQQ